MGFARKTAHLNSSSEIAVIRLRVKSHDDWSGNEKSGARCEDSVGNRVDA